MNRNSLGQVMAYVITEGQPEIQQLFRKYGIQQPVTPDNILNAILVYGTPFLYEFDVSVIRPYSAEIAGTNFTGEKDAAQVLASNQKNPNRGTNILTGITAATDILGTVLGTVTTIRNNKNPQATANPTTVYVPAPATSSGKENTDEEKKTKMYMYIGGGLILAVVMLFLFMQMKKK